MYPGDSPPHMLTAKHAAAFIRSELKARFGLNRRAVSVRTVRYGLSTSIDLSVLVPGIPLRKVGRIAKPYERIFRDSRTNEILKGGNRFVGVKLEDNVLTPFLGPIHTRLHKLPTGSPDDFHPVRFGRYCFEIARTVDRTGEAAFRLNGPRADYYTPHLLTKTLAVILAQSRQWHELLSLLLKESRS
jgi:hypothetical protein